MKLFYLSTNKKLAEDIVAYAKTTLFEDLPLAGGALTHFADGEVLFESKEPVRGEDVYIIQSTCAPANDTLMELLICIDACKRASAKSINCIIPYLGYARQDRKNEARQSISSKLVANLLQAAGADSVICVDLHATQIVGFFDIPVDNLVTTSLFYNILKKEDLTNLVCVSPDHGGVVRTTKLASKLGVPIAIIDKRRPEPNKSEIVSIVGEVKDKDCVIVDDIVDTAGTLCNAANELKKLGAKSVRAFITHGVLSKNAIELIDESGLDKLIISDSIPLKRSCDKIDIVPLSPLIAEVLVALKHNQPLKIALNKFEKGE